MNKEHFKYNILLINLKTEQWWKTKPLNILINNNIKYNDIIKAGIYIYNK